MKTFLMPYFLLAGVLVFLCPSQSSGDIINEPNTFEVKASLVAWLVRTSLSDEDFISNNLALNRSLEKKECASPITFTFTTTNKRLVKAECADSWRRFIKIPSQIEFKPSNEIDPIQARNSSTEALLLTRLIKKDELITQDDIALERITGINPSSLVLDLEKNTKVYAAHDLSVGAPLLIADILVGQYVLAAKTTIPSGSGLTKELAGLEIRHKGIPADAISSTQEWAFMETNRNVSAGEILRKRHFRKAKLVRRNDPVTLVNTSGPIKIFASGTASQDGYYGQQVKVKNSESGRVVLGKVVGRGRIEINQDTPNL